jgi:transcriptional regulator with XRE-family HTH domain
MPEPLYTEQGLLKLAQIIKQARGSRSYRELEALSGVSHATIRRLEFSDVKNPDIATLANLAVHTPYSLEELIAVAEERQKVDIRQYRTAEEAIGVVDQLNHQEAAKLAQMIIGRLAKMDVKIQENPPDDGLMLQIRLMSQEQMAEVLRAVANRLSPSVPHQESLDDICTENDEDV